ncbi:MAG: Hsp20/alpha crystallin family protein [Candidatus Saganbacteria bacterium]|nr:Hsp20/alpha crystallin family protein [Candidatus Saganbacteria bacterium]
MDVFEEADEIKIILDVPGFKEEEVCCEIKKMILYIWAKTLGRQWKESITLPVEVDEKKITTKYQNAVLEITLVKKKKRSKKNDKSSAGSD